MKLKKSAGSPDPGAGETLRLAALIQRAGQAPERWPEALAALARLMACSEVFDRIPGLDSSDLHSEIGQLAAQARTCAESRATCCGTGAAGADGKRGSCLALAEHLDLALDTAARLVDRRGHPLAEEALNAIDKPLMICAENLRLIHANHAAAAELSAGRWLKLREGALALVGDHETRRLRREIAGFAAGAGERALSLRLLHAEALRAELRVNRLGRREDRPGLFLLRLVVVAGGRLAPPPERVDVVRRHRGDRRTGMTPRQRELALHLLDGCGVSEAARRMGISRATASEHMKGLFTLSHTTRQAELIAWLGQTRFE